MKLVLTDLEKKRLLKSRIESGKGTIENLLNKIFILSENSIMASQYRKNELKRLRKYLQKLNKEYDQFVEIIDKIQK